MAEKAEKKPEAPAPAAAEKKESKGGIFTKLPVLLGGVMAIEAAVLLGGFWLMRSKPPAAAGATLAATDAASKTAAADNKAVEIPVVDFKALNRINGHTFLYDVSIYIVTKSSNEQRITQLFKDDKALIEDRLRTIIAQSDPDKLGGGSEPGLETLRRQVKYQLERIAGDGVIDEVLVPRCIPFRTDY